MLKPFCYLRYFFKSKPDFKKVLREVVASWSELRKVEEASGSLFMDLVHEPHSDGSWFPLYRMRLHDLIYKYHKSSKLPEDSCALMRTEVRKDIDDFITAFAAFPAVFMVKWDGFTALEWCDKYQKDEEGGYEDIIQSLKNLALPKTVIPEEPLAQEERADVWDRNWVKGACIAAFKAVPNLGSLSLCQQAPAVTW